MEDFIKRLAADEGWTPSTTVIVLSGVLQQLVKMGAADPEDLEAMVRTRGGVSASDAPDGPPDIGDRIEMIGVDTVIEVEQIPDEQPEADEGVYAIIDQYGETHRVEHDGGNGWVALIPAI